MAPNTRIAVAAAAVVALIVLALGIALAGGSNDPPPDAIGGPGDSLPGTSLPLDDIRDSTPVPSPDTPISSPPQTAPGVPPAPTPQRPPASPPPSGLLPLPPGTERVRAPIDGLQIAVRESFPPQYAAQIKVGLPSGCAKPAGYEVTRSGDVIRIDVYNSMPTGNPICTAIYGMYDLTVNLGSDFQPGQTYSVQVNDKTVSFRAQ